SKPATSANLPHRLLDPWHSVAGRNTRSSACPPRASVAACLPESFARSTASAAVRVLLMDSPWRPTIVVPPNRIRPASPLASRPAGPSSPPLLPNRSPRPKRSPNTRALRRSRATRNAPHAPATDAPSRSSAVTPSRRTTELPSGLVLHLAPPPVRPRSDHVP